MIAPRARLAPARMFALALTALVGLAGCETREIDVDPEKEQSVVLNVIDESNLSDLMLTIGDPNEAVEYFRRSLAQDPTRTDLKRGFAMSLARAKRYGDAQRVFAQLVEAGEASDADRMEYAYVSSRLEDWTMVDLQLAALSDGYSSPRRWLVTAMLADHGEDWAAADAAYERAVAMSPAPSVALNNWGVSKMSRGEIAEAIKTLEQAVRFNPDLFNPKNNLVIARGLNGQYRLPAIKMTELERARLLHNLGLIALRRGDVNEAKGLFADAVDISPTYYGAAAEKLKVLEASDS